MPARDGDQGVQLYRNEIDYLLPAPIPGTAVRVASGLAGLAMLRRHKQPRP